MLAIGYDRVRVYREQWLNWECYHMVQENIIVMGQESYPQLVYAVEVKPNILECDPGPLDARVP